MNLDVKFFSQKANLLNGPPIDDPTGCWYASAKMIGVYWDGTPLRIGVPELNNSDGTHRGLGDLPNGADGYGRLALNEKLKELQLDSFSEIEAALTEMGPIMFFWYVPQSANIGEDKVFAHASVIVGTFPPNKSMIFHDPAVGPNRQISVDLLRFARTIGPKRPMFARNPATIPRKHHYEPDARRGIEYPGTRLKPR